MKYITTLLLFVSLSVFAQSKTGTIDIDYIITQMPDFAGVQTTMDTYGGTLDADFQAKLAAYTTAVEKYKADEATLSIDLKQEQQQALLVLENDLNKFRSNGAKLMDLKRDDALRPLYNKIGLALDVVAKAQQFTLILETNDSMVYIDASTDVTRAVLTQLGITIKE